ncbi:MAG: hypothetical protein GKC05_03370 [Methanomicrobiales archaeon]|nr:hypothetical protein [Methanomicrobiales archaeon]NYT21326.1 hypothetical protein [Methanomicrobiales archaeon]
MTGDRNAEKIANRWMRAQRALKAGDRACAGRLSSLMLPCTPAWSAGIGDPLEVTLFSLLVGMVKDLDTNGDES